MVCPVEVDSPGVKDIPDVTAPVDAEIDAGVSVWVVTTRLVLAVLD